MPDQLDENFFRQLCVNAGIATIATDTDFRIIFWNAAASRIFGGAPETMCGKPLLSILPEDRRSLTKRLLERTLRRGGISKFIFEAPLAGETPTHLAVTLSPIGNPNAPANGIALHIRNVTRRIESERALARAEKMSALGSMAGAIAHHFNNLLAGLITTADFAQQANDNTTLKRALRSIVDSLYRTGKLTRALQAFAEGDQSDTESEDVNRAVETFLENLQTEVADKTIKIETDLKPVDTALPARRLYTILDSLVANACEAMPNGGTLHVHLSLTSDGRKLLLRITDTGCGIPNEDLERVFEPFFTTKGGDNIAYHGHVGLGLAVVHGIVRDLGGTITLCSSHETGTICSVQLPRPQ